MAQLWEAPEICPVCGYDHLITTRVRCPDCGSAVEGEFAPRRATGADLRRSGPLAGASKRAEARFGSLARLNDEQLEFVEVFLRCRGVIKNVEDMLGVSYPTVKGRLNAVLEAMGLSAEDDAPPADQRRMRHEILNDLKNGRITADEAHTLLARAQLLGDDER